MAKNDRLCPVVFAADNKYVPYLWCCISSLIEHCDPQRSYDLYVLNSNISEDDKKEIAKLATDKISINFIGLGRILDTLNQDMFYTGKHFTVETYYRFFLPQVLDREEKVVYLDCDGLVLGDVGQLYDFELGDNYLAATRDLEIIRSVKLNGDNYFSKVLGLDNCFNYFQAGCMVLNLDKMRQDDVLQKLIRRLVEIRRPLYADQCILNSVCKGRVLFLPQIWNYTWQLPIIDNNWYQHLGKPYNQDYLSAKDKPLFIHFAGENMKPEHYPELPEARLFWQYAARSPYFLLLLDRHIEMMKEKLAKLQKRRKRDQKYQFWHSKAKRQSDRQRNVRKICDLLANRY